MTRLQPAKIIAFTKVDLPYGWLGNMAPYPVAYEDLTYRTTEALFQALRFKDRAIRQQIHAEKSPMAANPDLERFSYRRAGSKVTVIAGASHSVYESHAADVADVIDRAARQLDGAVD